MHVCCAPCTSYVLSYLADKFDMTLYYYNPNIFPAEEYELRYDEFVKLNSSLVTTSPYKLEKGDYDKEAYYGAINGLESEREGGARCEKCFELRLRECAAKANDGAYDYFGTTLTISPHKNCRLINELGRRLEGEYGISFLYADFKKLDGYKKSIEFCKNLGIYRQEYCGCEFSMRSET